VRYNDSADARLLAWLPSPSEDRCESDPSIPPSATNHGGELRVTVTQCCSENCKKDVTRCDLLCTASRLPETRHCFIKKEARNSVIGLVLSSSRKKRERTALKWLHHNRYRVTALTPEELVNAAG
jgi:hypothetical protein